jgi:hypothetical protein
LKNKKGNEIWGTEYGVERRGWKSGGRGNDAREMGGDDGVEVRFFC